MVPPCREMCLDARNSCGKLTELLDIIKEYDCDYLPSRDGDIPCFYKPVTCGPLPEVTNALLLTDFNNNDTNSSESIRYNSSSNNTVFPLNFEAEYTCEGDIYRMIGSPTVKCRYSGLWSKTPNCSATVFIVAIVVSIAVLIVVVFSVIVLLRRIRQATSSDVHLTRNKEYDAFVCYDIADADYAHNTIIDEFEVNRNPPFKLCIHKRDFKPAYTIKYNIWNAIKNSNSAIIVMSQSYVDSIWCRDEFEGCYVENLEDPAFGIFVITMKPVEDLENTDEYMKSFFASRTYLEKNDPNVFDRIAQYLYSVKQTTHSEGD